MFKQYTCDSVIKDIPITFNYDEYELDNNNMKSGVNWNYITREIYLQNTNIWDMGIEILIYNEYGDMKRKLYIYCNTIKYWYGNNHVISPKMNILFIPRILDCHIDMYRCSDGSHITTLYPSNDTKSNIMQLYMNDTLNILFVTLTNRLQRTIVAYDFNV